MMLYGRRTGTYTLGADTEMAHTNILVHYHDGEYHWQYDDAKLADDTRYHAEEATIYDPKQGTYIPGIRLMQESLDAVVANPNPRLLADVPERDIEWSGGLSAYPLTPDGLSEGGEFL